MSDTPHHSLKSQSRTARPRGERPGSQRPNRVALIHTRAHTHTALAHAHSIGITPRWLYALRLPAPCCGRCGSLRRSHDVGDRGPCRRPAVAVRLPGPLPGACVPPPPCTAPCRCRYAATPLPPPSCDSFGSSRSTLTPARPSARPSPRPSARRAVLYLVSI